MVPNLFGWFVSCGAQIQPMRRWFVVNHFQIKTSGSHRSFVFLFCLLHGSTSISPISFIGGVKTTWGGDVYLLNVKMSKVKFKQVLPIFFVSVTWPRAYLTDSLHMWYKCNPWCNYVPWFIFRSYGRSKCLMLHGLFDHFPSYGAPIRPTRRRCVRYHFQVKVQGQVSY